MNKDKEIIVSEQVLQVPFRYSAGKVTSRFLTYLRDESVIYGIKCPGCGKVYVPPRSVCGGCFRETGEWVALSGEGLVESFSAVHYLETVHSVEAPFIIGIIKLDGADTGMVHFIRGISEENLKIGQRVKARFSDERKGHILDISHFETLK